jgi:hypothetical protein
MPSINLHQTTFFKFWYILPISLAFIICWSGKNFEYFRKKPNEKKVQTVMVNISTNICLFVWWCLTPLSKIFQLYRGGRLLVEETWWIRENHWPFGSHWQTLLHNVVHLILIKIRTHNISDDRHRLHRQQ